MVLPIMGIRSFLFVILFIPFFALAQNQEQKSIDILLKQIAAQKTDTAKIPLLDSIAYIYKNIDPNEGVKYARQELELAVKHNSKISIANANSVLGLNYEYRSDYPEALECFYISLGIYEKAGFRYNVASTSNNIGNIYQAQNNYPKALEYYLKALKIDEDMHNTGNAGGDLGNIGIVYMLQSNFNEALDYDLRSLAIFRKIGDSDGIAHNLGNIGNVYKVQGNYRQALDFDVQAIKIFHAEGDKGSFALNLGNVGGVYLAIAKDTTGKIKYHDFMLTGKTACLNKAIEYLDKSLVISKEIDQMDNVMTYSQGLYEAYSILGNYKMALESYKQYTAAKDSVFSNEDKIKIAQLGIQRELEVKNKQIQIDKLAISRKRDRDELYIVCMALGLLILVIILKRIFPRLF